MSHITSEDTVHHPSKDLARPFRRPKGTPREVVEIRIFWQRELLEVVEWKGPDPYFIGDGSREPVDFVMPSEDARTALVGFKNGRPVVHVPPGAKASRRERGKRAEQAAMKVVTSALAEELVLDEKTSIDVEIGALSFAIGLGEREAPCPRALVTGSDSRPLAFFGLALAASGALVASLAFFMPPLGLTDDDALDQDRRYLMQSYLDASAERERDREPEKESASATERGLDSPAKGASGDPGKIGRRDVTAQHRRASGTAPGADLRPATTREEQLAIAQNFGVIGLLNTGAASMTHAAFEDSGAGITAAAGGFFSSDVGDVGGTNGLFVAGNAQGGGFRGDQIGLGTIGTCHGEECLGKSGWGTSSHLASRGHAPRAPSLRMGKTIVDRGSLPPEVIQRVVRQSFGRFRGCYEVGLRINPNLEGRVTARFVIARDGSVATVQSGGTDLPDAGVVSCVLRAYRSLTFPSPKDGVVTVTYPLTFSPAT